MFLENGAWCDCDEAGTRPAHYFETNETTCTKCLRNTLTNAF